ncbi:MAG TPA: indole-3-glycerol phosphate synthase TrpC, partial [Bacteroidota bacterium]|nr:indole-3-glycerol phosphate synthase TrpC [Bacteroidota bacterium]
VLVEDFDHRKLAQDFAAGGASALSMLTDQKFFQGNPSFIRDVKEIVPLPVLRKDFIIDEYQVFESRVLGADAILLIVKALPQEELRRLYSTAVALGMDVLVETHTREELDVANSLGADLIGINNRDLGSFRVDLKTSLDLVPFVRPGAIAIAESGISGRRDIMALRNAGFKGALVGEGLVTKADRRAAVRELITD